MAKDPTMTPSRASRWAVGEALRRQCFFAPLREQGQLPQKPVIYRPTDQVLDGLVGRLGGATTISQRPVTMRVDPAVQRACGRTGGADQAPMARTLPACTAATGAPCAGVSW